MTSVNPISRKTCIYMSRAKGKWTKKCASAPQARCDEIEETRELRPIVTGTGCRSDQRAHHWDRQQNENDIYLRNKWSNLRALSKDRYFVDELDMHEPTRTFGASYTEVPRSSLTIAVSNCVNSLLLTSRSPLASIRPSSI